MLCIKPFPESIKNRDFLFLPVFLYGIKSNTLRTMDLLFHVEELVDIHKPLHCRLSMVVLFAIRDGIYQIPANVCLISELE